MSPLPTAPLIDVPFEFRHCCWFCHEPSNLYFSYIKEASTPHPSLSVPACQECLLLAKANPLTSIWDCRVVVKDALLKKYQKHLAIGQNWTQEEIESAEFDDNCKIFGGFKKSAWFMYQVAKKRINAQAWPLQIDGLKLDDSGHYQLEFEFDGVSYSSLYRAIEHYSKSMALDKQFLTRIVEQVGRERFSYGIRLARIHIASNEKVKQAIIEELKQESL